MRAERTTRVALALLALWISLLSACTSVPVSPVTLDPSAPPARMTYLCGQADGFNVTFGQDSAVLTGPRGRQELLRDAGGLTPQQTVYSNASFRAEFGLGPEGREAVLRTVKPQTVLRCVRG